MITPQQALLRLIDNNELFYDEMQDLMRQIMRGEVLPEQIAGILVGLRIKVETVSEIAAAASVMREFAVKVPVAPLPHGRRRCENLQYFHHVHVCGRRRRGAGGETRRTFRVLVQRCGRCVGAAGRVAESVARSHCAAN